MSEPEQARTVQMDVKGACRKMLDQAACGLQLKCWQAQLNRLLEMIASPLWA